MKNEAGRPVWAKGFWSGIDRNAKLVIFSDVVGSLGRSLVWFAGPFLILALGGGKVDLGDIFAIATFVSAAVTLLAGISSDFFKRRDLFLWAGAALQLFSYSMLVTANSLDVLLLANVMASIASALFMPTKMTIIGDTVESSKKNQVFAALFLFDNVSFGMGNIVGFFVFQDATAEISLAPLRFALIIALSFMLLEFLVVLFIRDRGKKDLADEYRQKPRINGSTKLFDRRTAILVVAANYTVSLGAGTSIIFMSVFFNDYYGISLALISLIFGVMIFFTAYWGKIMGDMADRFGRVKSIFATQMVATVLLYILSAYPPFVFALLTLIVRNAFMNGSSPVINALLTDSVDKRRRGTWVSVNMVGWSALFAIGNSLGGRIIENYSYGPAFFVTATLYLIGTLIFLAIKEDRGEGVLKESNQLPVSI